MKYKEFLRKSKFLFKQFLTFFKKNSLFFILIKQMKSQNYRHVPSGGVISPQGIFYKPPKNEAPLPPGAPVVWMQK